VDSGRCIFFRIFNPARQVRGMHLFYPHMTPSGAKFFICWKMLPGQWHLGCNYSIHTLPLPILDTLRGQILHMLDIYPHMTPSGAKFFICWKMLPGQWHLGCNYSIHTLPLPILDTIRGQILNILDNSLPIRGQFLNILTPYPGPYSSYVGKCCRGNGIWVAIILSIHYRYPYLTPSGAKFLIFWTILPRGDPSGAKFFICWRMPGPFGLQLFYHIHDRYPYLTPSGAKFLIFWTSTHT
jgi:hypothetical protein